MNEQPIAAQTRTNTGKAHARRMRRLESCIPGVIYGAKKDPELITLSHKDIALAAEHEAFFSQILSVAVDGKPQRVVLKDLARHPAKPKILHVDFQRVSATEVLTMTIPLHFTGQEDAPGLEEAGVITHQITEIEIKCLPAALPKFIEVDLSGMTLDSVVHLSEVKLPKGVQLSTPVDDEYNPAVASLHVPKVMSEPEPEEASEGEEAAAEGKNKNAEAKSHEKGQ